jgi:uncharacterized protein YukE
MNAYRFCSITIAVGAITALTAIFLTLWSRERGLTAYEDVVKLQLAANRKATATLYARRPLREAEKTIAPSPPPVTAPASKMSRGSYQDSLARVQKALRHMPEYQPWLRAFYQRNAMKEYGEWFSQLHVSVERLAFLKERVAEELIARQDAYKARAEAGLIPGSQEDTDQAMRDQDQSNGRLLQALTPDEFAGFRDFERANTWRRALPEMDEYFAEQAVPALSPDQRRAFTAAALDAVKWRQQIHDVADGVGYRMQTERIGSVMAPSLDPIQRGALLGYIQFFNQRTKIIGQLSNPDAPDSIAYVGGPSF